MILTCLTMIKRNKMLIFLISVSVLILTGFLFMQQKSFGQNPQGQRLEHILKSPNYKDGKFQNLVETPVMAKDISYWKLIKQMFHSENNRIPPKSLPSIHSNLKGNVIDSTEIIWFGHSSYLIKTLGKNILVDPVFSKRASPVSFTGVTCFAGSSPFSINDLPNIDVMVLTHDHYDHMDYKTIMLLKNRTQIYIVPLGVGQHLEHWGIDPKKIIELDWWEKSEVIPGIEFTATPARHFSGRGFVRNKTLWASFVVKTNKSKIFIGGDSGFGPQFKEIGEKFGPFDIAFLESGQYNKFWPNIHSMPEETVQEAVELKTKVLFPVHWGKFKLSLHPWDEPIKRVIKRADEMQVTYTTPLIGEPIILEGNLTKSKWFELISE